MSIDFKKTPVEMMLDLVNQTNGITLTAAQVEFNMPVPNPLFGQPGAKDTLVSIVAKPGTPYLGSSLIEYWRIDLGAIMGAQDDTFQKDYHVNISDLIPAINARYGFNLTSEDYLNGPLPDMSALPRNSTVSFEVQATPGSLVFRGSLPLKLTPGEQDIADLVMNNVLNGIAPLDIHMTQLVPNNILNGLVIPA